MHTKYVIPIPMSPFPFSLLFPSLALTLSMPMGFPWESYSHIMGIPIPMHSSRPHTKPSDVTVKAYCTVQLIKVVIVPRHQWWELSEAAVRLSVCLSVPCS